MMINKFNYQPINRETVDGKRHYCLPDGTKVPSVTTILGETKPEESRQALQAWRNRVGKVKAQEITTEAANRGTRMHKWLETYIKSGDLGEPGSNPYSKQSHGMASTIINQGLKNNVSEFWGVEVPLYYSGLYAGTSDSIGLWRDQPAILDYKQTNKLKRKEWIEDYFLQLAAYAQAHDNMYGTKIKCGIILMCSSSGEYQEFIIKDAEFDGWINKWYDRLELYYQL